MQAVSMKQLLEAGVHFGHQKRRWNPKMRRYIYTERNGIYIVDLKKTLKMLREACLFVRATVTDGGRGVFVGTKKQAREAIVHWAEQCNMHYVNNRWLGGILTNWQTVSKNVKRLLELEKMGMKIRDSEDEFKGAEFRDEKTKLMFAYDYTAKYTVRVWGSNVKSSLYKECQRLGVKIFDRVMITW